MSTKVVDELTAEAESLGMYDDEFEIESNVPLPQRGSEIERISHTLAKMEVGDSVLVRRSPGRDASRAVSLWHMAARIMGRKAATRTVDGGVRVWRTK